MNDYVLTDKQREVVLALADCSMSITKTSKKIFRNRNTVLYHIRKVNETTGKDPMNFYDLIELVEATIERKDK